MSEQSIIGARASVMVYDDTQKKWVPSGTSSGLSKVQIYHHHQNNTFRVVGRKLQDHEVVINCSILKGLKYNQATATFHQWRDSKYVYGLNFSSQQDAEAFARAMMHALEVLSGRAMPNTAPIPNNGNVYDEDMGYRTMTREDAEIIQQQQTINGTTTPSAQTPTSQQNPNIPQSPPAQQGHHRTSRNSISAPPAPQPPQMSMPNQQQIYQQQPTMNGIIPQHQQLPPQSQMQQQPQYHANQVIQQQQSHTNVYSSQPSIHNYNQNQNQYQQPIYISSINNQNSNQAPPPPPHQNGGPIYVSTQQQQSPQIQGIPSSTSNNIIYASQQQQQPLQQQQLNNYGQTNGTSVPDGPPYGQLPLIPSNSSTSLQSNPSQMIQHRAAPSAPPPPPTGFGNQFATPPAPPQPPVPTMMAICAPPAPPLAIGGGPPPPPPPPMGGLSLKSDDGGMGSLAAQLQQAKLKKKQTTPQPTENSGSSTSSGGSGNYGTIGRSTHGMASMMDEMAKTLARRRAQAEKKEPDQSDDNQGKQRPWEKSNTLPHKLGTGSNHSSNNNQNSNNSNNGNSESPRPMRKRFGSASEETILKQVNGDGLSLSLSADLDSIKSELLKEMRLEIQKAKQEIIDAIKSEFNRR